MSVIVVVAAVLVVALRATYQLAVLCRPRARVPGLVSSGRVVSGWQACWPRCHPARRSCN